MTKFIIQFLFYSVLFSNLHVNAGEYERIVEKALKCIEDHTLSPEDLEIFAKFELPDNENAKCVMACIYKTAGLMDDHGMLSVEGVNKVARIFMFDDPEPEKKAEDFKDACLSVNDVEVSDGAKGCERAALIFNCRSEKAPEFVFIK